MEDLWVEPALFGRGYGRRLFLHAAETARSLGWTAMSIESDPGAESFYEMMGAVRIGERRSGVGRMVPLMSMTLGTS